MRRLFTFLIIIVLHHLTLVSQHYFDDSGTEAGICPGGECPDIRGGSWIDYDLDGNIDMVINKILNRYDGSKFNRIKISIDCKERNNFTAGVNFVWADFDNDGDLDAFLGEDEAMREGVRVLETTAAFPYGVLMVPLEVPLSVRLSMETGVLNIANAPDMAEVMRAFLGQDLLVGAAPEDFADLNVFMESTGLDFAQLGS